MHFIWFLFFPIIFISVKQQTDIEKSLEGAVILYGDINEYEEPAMSLVYTVDDDKLILLDVRFPEDVLRLIECCEQDSISYLPVESYLQRTSNMDEYQIQEEEEVTKIVSRLQGQKRKLIRKWIKSNGFYTMNANIELCSCLINDPIVEIDTLHLIRSLN